MIMSSWYSYNRLLSHNSFINFVMSPRGNGKSYGAKKLVIENWLKRRKQSVYVRRTVTEMQDVKNTYWNDIKAEYPNLEFDIKGDVGLIDDEVVIYFIPLSTSSKKKSASYPLVNQIFFDEYVITTSSHNRYLKNEMTLLLDLIETIFRKRTGTDMRVIFMANAVSFVNPLFTFFNIEPNPNKRFQKFKDNLICLELFTDENFMQEKRETPFGRLIDGTAYGNYAIGNVVLEDSDDFILPKKYAGSWAYHMTLKSNGFTVGVWADYLNDIFYIDKKYHLKSTTHNYTILSEDNEEGFLHIHMFRNKEWRIKHLKKAFNEGNVYYINQEVKKFFLNNVIKYI